MWLEGVSNGAGSSRQVLFGLLPSIRERVESKDGSLVFGLLREHGFDFGQTLGNNALQLLGDGGSHGKESLLAVLLELLDSIIDLFVSVILKLLQTGHVRHDAGDLLNSLAEGSVDGTLGLKTRRR